MTTTYTATGDAHPISWVPLSRLVPWDGNVRKTGATDGLGELTASIAAHGVLQSLVVRKTNRGKYAVIAGRRRFLALSALAEGGTIEADAPIPCRVLARSADATEISLTENVVRAPMHPADQFEAFRDLIDNGASVADVAARFGITETAVKQRLRLARVSPTILAAYRAGDLTLEQTQAFAVSDDHAAQDRVLSELPDWQDDPEDIRSALTQEAIPATDRRTRFVTLAAYEAAGGAVQRDLFADAEDGVFLLDSTLLDRLVREKLQATVEALHGEGWKWVEAVPEFDQASRGDFRVRRPEPLPLSDEAAAERKDLADEYARIYDTLEDGDEEASERLDAIEARIEQLEETERAYAPEVFAIAGAIVTIGRDGEPEILRGIVRPEDEPDAEAEISESTQRPEFSAALVQSLTEAKSAAIGAELASRPKIALAAVVHRMAGGIFGLYGAEGCVELSAKVTRLHGTSGGESHLSALHDEWAERVPGTADALWSWCLSQDQETLLDLLAYCAARIVNAVQAKQDRPDGRRLSHANALAAALDLDMTRWFTPTAENFFLRVGRKSVVAAMTEAKGVPAKRSWDKLTKAALAAQAEREIAATGWLPQPLRA